MPKPTSQLINDAELYASGAESARGARVGDVIEDRYELTAKLGEGGYGIVFGARNLLTNREVALKLLNATHAFDDMARARLVRESRILSNLSHPGIVRVDDLFERRGGELVMVMEWIRGDTLATKVAQRTKRSWDEISPWFLAALDAVAAAHDASIIHRDLKPENLFVLESSSESSVKVVDFGLAKAYSLNGLDAMDQSASTLTQSGELMGTPYYMAPEQVFGERDLDARVDVWAFGVMMYEALAGVRPTDAAHLGGVLRKITTGKLTPLASHGVDAPAAIIEVVDAMLAFAREDRPHDLRDVLIRMHSTSTTGAREPDGDLQRLKGEGPLPAGATPKKTASAALSKRPSIWLAVPLLVALAGAEAYRSCDASVTTTLDHFRSAASAEHTSVAEHTATAATLATAPLSGGAVVSPPAVVPTTAGTGTPLRSSALQTSAPSAALKPSAAPVLRASTSAPIPKNRLGEANPYVAEP